MCWQAPCSLASNCRTARLFIEAPTFGEGPVGILCCLPIVMEFGRVAPSIPAQALLGYGRTTIVPGVPHAPSQTCGRVGALGFDRALGCGMLCGVGSLASTSTYALSIDKNDARASSWLPRCPRSALTAMRCRRPKECYLVDPASSHMLFSKINPCMCKYELIQTVKLRMAH